MARYQKVVWYEGMNLEPHHFQQWDRHHRSELNSRLRSLIRYHWGITQVTINKEALTNGQFELQNCKGIMPDGLSFNMPDDDPLPKFREVQNLFPATMERLPAYLVLPLERPDSRNCVLDDLQSDRDTRFIFEEIRRHDDNTGGDERRVGVGRPNFQIRFEGESLEDFSPIKIAEVIRTPDGTYALNENFIPPCLTISASESLMKITRRLLELLVTRSSNLMERRRYQPSGHLEVSASDIAVFWLLHTVNSFIPLLNYYHSSAKYHPEELYRTCLALVGQLATFSPVVTSPPTDMPIYNHSDLANCFNRLESRIKELLGEVVPKTPFIRITLEKRGEMISYAKIEDVSLFHDAEFYLACKHDLDEKQVADEFPKDARIASPEMLNGVIASAITALRVEFKVRPPAGVPVKQGIQYFRLDKQGHFWDAICTSKAICIYVPKDKFPDMQLELYAIRQG
jgi:type VI secretion system protein ImpJ